MDEKRHKHRVEVALGVILREASSAFSQSAAGEVLVTQRPANTPYANYWEFPGGKVEPGETAAACVVRELREELGVEVAILGKSRVIEHVYEHAWVRLRPYWCRIVTGSPPAVEVAAWRWVDTRELAKLAMPEGNKALVTAVRRKLALHTEADEEDAETHE